MKKIRMNRKQRELVSENYKLATKMLTKLIFPPNERDDVLSALYLGLCKAAVTFDSKKKTEDGFVKFSTYATKVMKNEFLLYLRKKRSNKVVAYIDAIPYDQEFVLDTSSDDDFNGIINSIDLNGFYHKIIVEAIESLQDSQKEIVTVYLGDVINGSNSTQAMIAKKIGCTQPSVSRTIRTFQGKIRELTEKYEIAMGGC